MDVSFTRRGSSNQQIDWWFIGAIVFLVTLGLIMQYSIGLNQSTPDLSQFYKQLIFVAIGTGLFVTLSIVDNHIIRTHPFIHAGVGIAILILVLLFGTTLKGATGWFVIGGISFQPVEFIKLLFMFFMASYFEKKPHSIQQPRFFFASGIISAIFVGLVLLQPDTGSALILFVIWFTYIIMLRVPKKFIGLVVAALLVAFALGWFVLFPDYQKQRLVTFMNPGADPLGAGYNVTQSIVAVGSGSWWGRGLGLGTQSQLHFLPEVSSDFIFAVIAEELGFIGVLSVIIALGIIIFRLWLYMMETKDHFSFLFLIGVTSYLLVQSFMVIGMNIGILPVTGVPLPLVSAGGSSMLTTLCMLGIGHHIGRKRRRLTG